MNSKYPLCIEQSSGSITYFATFRSLCHSFVLDPNDKIYVNEEVFTDFRVFDIRELRKAIFKSQHCWDGREKNKELTVYTLGLDSPAGYLCNYVE
ncbi:hypothetical protein GLOIN_2v1741550 [Rhizophagus irregularis DAOM 181602=DAOM 197198]|nr:hypothetical protein GLOIN_2v1741550 [Rhizophagus irregularis DAOM 181602=DAOM 197198]